MSFDREVPKRQKLNADDKNTILSDFLAWAKQHGINAPKVAVRKGAEPIDAGEEFVSVPVELAITVDAAKRSKMGRIVARFNQEMSSSMSENDDDNDNDDDDYNNGMYVNDKTLLLLFLISQKYTANTFWGPHLRAIPVSYDDPLWFNKRERAFLQGTNLGEALPHKRSELQKLFETRIQPLVEYDAAAFPEAVFTLANLRWANSAYTSRGFPYRLVDPTSGSVPSSSSSSSMPGDGRAGDENGDNETSGSTGAAADTSTGVDVDVDMDADAATSSAIVNAEGKIVRKKKKVVGCLIPFIGFSNHRYAQKVTWITKPAPSRNNDNINNNNSNDNNNNNDNNNTDTMQNAAASEPLSISASTPLVVLDPPCPAFSGARIVFRIETPVAKDDEIWNNYGAKGNEEFLMGYGFALLDNKHDEFTVAIGAQGMDGNKKKKMRDLGLGLSYYLCSKPYSLPDKLLQCLRLCFMNEYESAFAPDTNPLFSSPSLKFTAAEKGKAGVDTTTPANPDANAGAAADAENFRFLNFRNELTMLAQLDDLLWGRLMRLGSPSQDPLYTHAQERALLLSNDAGNSSNDNDAKDGETQTNPPLSSRAECALRYRLGQRQLLLDALQAVKELQTSTAEEFRQCILQCQAPNQGQSPLSNQARDSSSSSASTSASRSASSSSATSALSSGALHRSVELDAWFGWLQGHGGICNIQFPSMHAQAAASAAAAAAASATGSNTNMSPDANTDVSAQDTDAYPPLAAASQLRASQSLPAHSQLLKIPRNILITQKTAASSPSFAPCLGMVRGVDEDTILTLFLLHEMSKHYGNIVSLPSSSSAPSETASAQSVWGPFFDAVRAFPGYLNLNTPVAWAESERAHLSKHGLSSYAESRERSEDLSDLYNQLFPALVDAVDGDEEEYTPNDDSDNSNERKSNGKRSKSFTLFDPSVVTEENFIWAACVVDMFSVQVGPKQVVLPLPIMPKHSSYASTWGRLDLHIGKDTRVKGVAHPSARTPCVVSASSVPSSPLSPSMTAAADAERPICFELVTLAEMQAGAPVTYSYGNGQYMNHDELLLRRGECEGSWNLCCSSPLPSSVFATVGPFTTIALDLNTIINHCSDNLRSIQALQHLFAYTGVAFTNENLSVRHVYRSSSVHSDARPLQICSRKLVAVLRMCSLSDDQLQEQVKLLSTSSSSSSSSSIDWFTPLLPASPSSLAHGEQMTLQDQADLSARALLARIFRASLDSNDVGKDDNGDKNASLAVRHQQALIERVMQEKNSIMNSVCHILL